MNMPRQTARALLDLHSVDPDAAVEAAARLNRRQGFPLAGIAAAVLGAVAVVALLFVW